MKYLAIDASTEACSVALIITDDKGEDKIISRYEICPQSHSLVLLPMVDEVLKEAHCKVQDLDGLIWTRPWKFYRRKNWYWCCSRIIFCSRVTGCRGFYLTGYGAMGL